jgi:hypothetical protein
MSEVSVQSDLFRQIALGAAAVVFLALLAWKFLRKKPTAEELERRRRAAIQANGKLGDGEVVDVEGVAVVYSYSVGGVGYTASQDVSVFEGKLPENTMALLGPALVKFDPRNPANSIVICEEWSGLGGGGRK